MLGEGTEVPVFPLGCLIGWHLRWIEAEAEATQTPPDLSAMLTLAIAGAALAKKYVVEIRPGWQEPVNLFTVVALPPGERKSRVFADAMAPVVDHEKAETERMAPVIAQAQADHRILETRLKKAEQHAASAPAGERDKKRLEARTLAAELASHRVPAAPMFFCDDITAEKLAGLIAEHGGRMLQAAAEGTAFEIAKGRYSETANFDVYLKGHAGDALRTCRVARAGEKDDHPALSVALAVQPDVIRGLAENGIMRGRGFLARFLYAIPQSRVGSRTIAPKPVPAGLAAEYHEGMLTLWRSVGTADEHGHAAAKVLRFSSDADRLMRRFEANLEPRLAPGEDLAYLAGWGNKLAGAVARISGILHIVQAVEDGSRWEDPIPAAIVEKAIRLGKDYLLPHAEAAFGIMGASERMEAARAVWESIRKHLSEYSECSESAPPCFTVSRRDIHQWNRRRFPGGAKEADPVLEILERHHLIRPQPQPGQQPGRGHASPVYEVNPAALMAGAET
jgi:hypothetical protein